MCNEMYSNMGKVRGMKMKSYNSRLKYLINSLINCLLKHGGGPWAARSISDHPYLNNLQRQQTLGFSLANLRVSWSFQVLQQIIPD